MLQIDNNNIEKRKKKTVSFGVEETTFFVTDSYNTINDSYGTDKKEVNTTDGLSRDQKSDMYYAASTQTKKRVSVPGNTSGDSYGKVNSDRLGVKYDYEILRLKKKKIIPKATKGAEVRKEIAELKNALDSLPQEEKDKIKPPFYRPFKRDIYQKLEDKLKTQETIDQKYIEEKASSLVKSSNNKYNFASQKKAIIDEIVDASSKVDDESHDTGKQDKATQIGLAKEVAQTVIDWDLLGKIINRHYELEVNKFTQELVSIEKQFNAENSSKSDMRCDNVIRGVEEKCSNIKYDPSLMKKDVVNQFVTTSVKTNNLLNERLVDGLKNVDKNSQSRPELEDSKSNQQNKHKSEDVLSNNKSNPTWVARTSASESDPDKSASASERSR